jgi:class 3 adenylate cyclase
MADGDLPGRGEFGECVQKALNFVLDHSTETGLLVSDETHGPMYGHGFATLFLGEIYGMNQEDDRVRDALVRAVQLIVSSQNDEGGWRYNPVPDDADVSVTICQVMALRSARNAGIKVPKSTIDDAIRYVRACQNSDGGFRYMKDLGGSAWPRTAAGVASLFYAGVYEGAAAGARPSLLAAREKTRAVARLSDELRAELPSPLKMGIGIHCGSTVVGHMGRGVATYLTAVGDAVNTASRLQDQTKHFACQLILSETVASRAGLDATRFRREELTVRNRDAPIVVRIVENVEDLLPSELNAEAAH